MILKKLVKKIKSFLAPEKPVAVKSIFTKDIFKNKKYIIGNYTYGKPSVLFENDQANLIIGKFCSIAEGVTIFLGGNHRVDWISTYPFNVFKQQFPKGKGIVGHPSTKGDVIIGNDVWIGRNATLMSGITIGNGAVIGTEALITKNIGDYEIWAGNPAKFIKKRFTDEQINKLNEMSWWDFDLTEISQNIDSLCSDNIQEFIKKNYDK